MKRTPEIEAALAHPITPISTKLAQVRDEVWLTDNYAIVVCGPDAEERQRIARSIWARLAPLSHERSLAAEWRDELAASGRFSGEGRGLSGTIRFQNLIERTIAELSA